MKSNKKHKKYVKNPRYGDEPILSQYKYSDEELKQTHWRYGSLKLIPKTVIPADINKQDYAVFPRRLYVDIEENCRTCKKSFIFYALEKKHWFEELGFFIDAHCIRCTHCRGKKNEIKKFHGQYQDLLKIGNRSKEETKNFKKVALELYQRGVIKNVNLIDRFD